MPDFFDITACYKPDNVPNAICIGSAQVISRLHADVTIWKRYTTAFGQYLLWDARAHGIFYYLPHRVIVYWIQPIPPPTVFRCGQLNNGTRLFARGGAAEISLRDLQNLPQPNCGFDASLTNRSGADPVYVCNLFQSVTIAVVFLNNVPFARLTRR